MTSNTKTLTKSAATTKTTVKRKSTVSAKKIVEKSSKVARGNQTDLIIVESPTKAKKISKFLGDKYTVVASNGHVRDLPKSTMGIKIDNNFEPNYITVRGKGELVDKIRKSAKAANHVYLATDPDREGEAISWHLASILGIDDKEKCRIVFNEITQSAVKNALGNARQIDLDLVDAQQARRVLDRLVGYKISPILWDKVKRGLSAGRVQSVATRMICDRQDDINAFVPEEYWTITARLKMPRFKSVIAAKFYGINGKKTDVHSEEHANDIIEKSKNAEFFIVSDVKTANKNRHAPAPFTTSSMQQEASRKLNMTSERTMKIAQELYEGAHFDSGMITYMRTDSVRVAAEAQRDALTMIGNVYGVQYVPLSPNVYKGGKNAQDAHEAIRPTSLKNTPQKLKEALTPQQYKLYKLIYDRFIASQMADAVVENTTVTFDANECTYKANGVRTVFDGYTAAYSENHDNEATDEKEVTLPKIEKEEQFALNEIAGEQHFTQPPLRYTDASLIKALDEYGIGRPSTYAPTISTIITRGYVRREKKLLCPTELGVIVTGIMKDNFRDIVDIKFTAEMEEKLDKIEDGGVDWTSVISEFYLPFETTVQKAAESIEKIVIAPEVSDIQCEKCGAMMIYKMGRFGRFLACPNYPTCKNTKPIIQKIDTPCPKCGASVIKRSSKGKSKVFYGCEKYPECDFVSWDLPLAEKCPICGAYMVNKLTERGKYKACSNKECTSHKRNAKSTKTVDKE